MGSSRSSKFSEREKSLLNDLVKGKGLSITKGKKMKKSKRHKQREAWEKIAVDFNAAGIGKFRTSCDLKHLWISTDTNSTKRCALQEHGSQDAHGIRLSVESGQALEDKSKLPLHTDECGSQDAPGIRPNKEISQDLANKANLPHTDGIIGSHLFRAGVSVDSEDGQQTFAEVPVQPFTADEELAATDTNIDTKVGIVSPPVESKLWQAQLKMLETQARIEHAQLKSLERQARIEEAQLQILKRQSKIEEAQLRCLERQAELNEAKLKVHDKKAKIEETHLWNLERQANIDESQFKNIQSQTKIEEAKSRILEGQVDTDALLQKISQHV
ncbi:uncharacterized protein LOC119575359 [Penaeus monodon]|uniref:uncharacterized protein LOC119575359 n=1 Tax=Penaeus monodon TaxID=6687 RepID=UPI0018A756A0|nr:uncharacterized protein LOC119575359 [Penaeus monodon]